MWRRSESGKQKKSNNVVRHPTHNTMLSPSLVCSALTQTMSRIRSSSIGNFSLIIHHFIFTEKNRAESFLILSIFEARLPRLPPAYHDSHGNERMRAKKMRKNHRFLQTFVFEFLVFKGNTLPLLFPFWSDPAVLEPCWKVEQQLITQWNFYWLRITNVCRPCSCR